MEIELDRETANGRCTIGRLSVDGVPECWTLEDVVREPGVKIPGRTAIPAGRYRVEITPSRRFNRPLPILLKVPGFTGIRIHSGNTAEDTEGCILVGKERGENSLLRSRDALADLQPKIQAAIDSVEEVWIEVRNPD